MIIFTNDEDLPKSESCVITLGNFDGVHRGHQKLIQQTVLQAQTVGIKSAVITFEPHTRSVVNGKATYENLTSFQEKAKLIELLGVDYLILLKFNQTIKELSPEEFIKNILIKKFHMMQWVMGKGHVIGKNRSMNESILSELSKKYHFKISIINLVTKNKEIISSTQIRNHLAQGRIDQAAVMLNHPLSTKKPKS